MSDQRGAGVPSRTRPAGPRRGPAAAASVSAALGLILRTALAAGALVEGAEGLTPVLPHTIHRGKPPGAAALRGVDWSRARRAELPAPEGMTVIWERRLEGGLSGDVLVDDTGRVFVTGQGRVLQLGPDGREQYLRRAEFSSAVASALLADGQRVVLAREGTLAAWSPDGEPGFHVELQIPAGWARGELLPLPEGGVLVSAGTWLLSVSAPGSVEGYTHLNEPVAETLISGGKTWILTERGGVFTWDGHSPPLKQGSFDGRVSTGAARAPGQLVAVLDGHELVEWSLATGQRRNLARLEGAGASARLSVPTRTLVHILGANGALFSLPLDALGNAEVPPEIQQLPAGSGELLSGADGTLAWLVGNAPLTLRRGEGLGHSLSEVVCAQPSSLVPAGPGRLLAACRSGQLWLVGPMATAPPTAADDHGNEPASLPPASNPQTNGFAHWQARSQRPILAE